MRRILFLTLFILLAVYSGTAVGADDLHVDIYGPTQSEMQFVLAQPLSKNMPVESNPQGPDQNVPKEAAELQSLLSNNLSYLPFLKEVPGTQIPGGSRLSGYSKDYIDFKRFQLANIDLLITTAWPNSRTVEIRAYDPFTNNLLVGKAYHDVRADKLPLLADRFCEALMEKLTGNGEFFRSTLAFVKKEGDNANIWTVRPTGRDLKKITSVPGIAMSPNWSRDARYITFSVVGKNTHMLGIWDRQNRKIQLRPNVGGTVIGPTFTPDNRILVSMSKKGTVPNIYLLDQSLNRQTPLVESWANDVSPRMDKDGRRMVFVSDRQGGPQIYNLDMGSRSVSRITTEGGYNSEPSLSPDGTMLTYSRMSGGNARIFVRDLTTGIERQVSFGPGRDEQPSFCSDGYFIAFTSNRGGANRIYLTTKHGTPAKMVETGGGNAKFPSFGLTDKE